jgi:hypothetical protein
VRAPACQSCNEIQSAKKNIATIEAICTHARAGILGIGIEASSDDYYTGPRAGQGNQEEAISRTQCMLNLRGSIRDGIDLIDQLARERMKVSVAQ